MFNIKSKLPKMCHSGGAKGSDTYFENISLEYGVKVSAYSYKTDYHNSVNKVEISEEDYLEGVDKIKIANKTLKRPNISKHMNLLSRNWSQVKYSDQIFAIGSIINPGQLDKKGRLSKSNSQIVSGGTGYAVQMGIDNKKEVYVFEQDLKSWYKWCYTQDKFIKKSDSIKITKENFAGIGTREINEYGISAIKNLFIETFLNV